MYFYLTLQSLQMVEESTVKTEHTWTFRNTKGPYLKRKKLLQIADYNGLVQGVSGLCVIKPPTPLVDTLAPLTPST